MSASDLFDGVMGRCVGAFGEGAEYRPSDEDEDSYDFVGIFNDKWTAVDQDTGSTVISSVPNLGVRLADFADGHPRQGDKVYITARATEYKINRIERDGEAGAHLLLAKTS